MLFVWEKNLPGFCLGTHESGFQSPGTWLGGFCRRTLNNGPALRLALVGLFVSILGYFFWGLPWLVLWLRLCAPSAGGLGLILAQGTRSHMPQLKILVQPN